MHRWHVTIEAGSLNIPGLGRCPQSVLEVVEANTIEEAVTLGLEKARESGWTKLGKARAIKLGQYHVTLRGRDKRRREAFVIYAEDEREAVRLLKYRSEATRFAGYRWEKDGSVVRVVRKG